MERVDPKPVTAQEIIDLILTEMHSEAMPSRYTVFVRSVFHVALYREDFESLKPLFPEIRKEALRALNEELAKLSGGLIHKLPVLGRRQKRYRPMEEFSIEFLENSDDDAEQNPVVITSSFGTPKAEPDRVGAMTERILKRNAEGTLSASSRTAASSGPQTAPVRYAVIEYSDDTGPHVFEVTRDQVRIGRGDYVHLKVNASRDISRTHAVIRRDTGSGRFYIKDLSKLGTTVNGKALKTGCANEDGGNADPDFELALPDKARIGLAGVVFLEFRRR
jgi:hypothetical protein